jgi:hypothetical protein
MTIKQTSPRRKPEQSSGTITIQGDHVTWHNIDLVFATFNLAEVIVIGEHTNSNGPWFDDWFIDFVTKDGNWFSIPWYADNIDTLTNMLCDKFQPDLNLSYLTSSTSWNSIIRHPSNLKGKQLFVLTPSATYKEPRNFFQRFLAGIGLGNFDTTNDINLTSDVKDELVKLP